MRTFWAYKKSIVIIHQACLTLDPPSLHPNTEQVVCGANCIFPSEGLSASFQAEPFTYYTVVPVPSLWSPIAQGCYGDPGCEFRCPLCSSLVSFRLIWYENSPPCFSLCGVPMARTQIYPLYFIYFFLLFQCLSFLPFSHVLRHLFPLARATPGCALGAMHWSFWNFLYVMLHQTIGAVNVSCGASPSIELQL